MNITKIGVIGAGTMGNGIAQVFAQSGFDVTLVDIKQDFVDRGMANIRKNLDKMVQKAILPKDQADKSYQRIKTSLLVKDLKDSNFIVEVIIEDLQTKKNLFKELDAITTPDVILASNTSSISITELAAVTKRPTQVIGMHFMNPVPLMKLVEVVKGLVTSQATIDTVNALCKKLGKTPVEVNDAPGFVANRILLPMINEAVYTLMEGVATKEAIDEVMKLGMNHRVTLPKGRRNGGMRCKCTQLFKGTVLVFLFGFEKIQRNLLLMRLRLLKPIKFQKKCLTNKYPIVLRS